MKRDNIIDLIKLISQQHARENDHLNSDRNNSHSPYIQKLTSADIEQLSASAIGSLNIHTSSEAEQCLTVIAFTDTHESHDSETRNPFYRLLCANLFNAINLPGNSNSYSFNVLFNFKYI